MSLVTTINLQLMRTARVNARFANILKNRSAVNLVDGWPVARLLRVRGVHASTAPGSDLTRLLLRSNGASRTGVFLLGDTAVTLDALRRRAIAEGWEGAISGAESPAPDEVDNERASAQIVDRINSTRARVLLVAFGAPRQELWLDKWANALSARVAIGVGGSFKFIAWPDLRAPGWMRYGGLEWLHRLALEPARLFPRYARDAVELARLAITESPDLPRGRRPSRRS